MPHFEIVISTQLRVHVKQLENNIPWKTQQNTSEESEDISYSWLISQPENRAISVQYQ